MNDLTSWTNIPYSLHKQKIYFQTINFNTIQTSTLLGIICGNKKSSMQKLQFKKNHNWDEKLIFYWMIYSTQQKYTIQQCIFQCRVYSMCQIFWTICRLCTVLYLQSISKLNSPERSKFYIRPSKIRFAFIYCNIVFDIWSIGSPCLITQDVQQYLSLRNVLTQKNISKQISFNNIV